MAIFKIPLQSCTGITPQSLICNSEIQKALKQKTFNLCDAKTCTDFWSLGSTQLTNLYLPIYLSKCEYSLCSDPVWRYCVTCDICTLLTFLNADNQNIWPQMFGEQWS